MSIVIGIDPGKRLGAAFLGLADNGQVATWESIALREDQIIPELHQWVKCLPVTEIGMVWIEVPDGHVMAGRIGLRQTRAGIKQTVYHHTNVMAIFQLGAVAGRVMALCDRYELPHRLITAGEVKRLVTGEPTISKAKLALYLESEGYTLPRLVGGKPDPEQVDALAIALAGAKKMEEGDHG